MESKKDIKIFDGYGYGDGYGDVCEDGYGYGNGYGDGYGDGYGYGCRYGAGYGDGSYPYQRS